MRKAILLGAVFALALCAATSSSYAGEFGTAQDARAMLNGAIREVKADPATAVAKFNKGEAGFKDRDLYVFCFNSSDGKTVAHASPGIIGQDVRTFTDKTGKVFGEQLYREAKEGEITAVTYMWPRPGQSEPVAKESYVTRIGGLVCGVGYYK